MATGGAPRRDGPVALSALFDDALRELVPRAPPTPPAPRGAAAASPAAPVSDGFLYSGNRHESVPRALFLDRRLTPLERNAWQVLRLQLQSDGVTAFPTYDQLRPYLASMPCAAQASHETVARALTLLRLTRWLSLVRRRRDRCLRQRHRLHSPLVKLLRRCNRSRRPSPPLRAIPLRGHSSGALVVRRPPGPEKTRTRRAHLSAATRIFSNCEHCVTPRHLTR